MKFDELLKVGASIQAAFEAEATDVCGTTLSFLHSITEGICESPIEHLFAVAWLMRLETYRIFGSWVGKAEYRYGSKGDLLPMQLEIVTPEIQQADIVNFQMPIGDYRADFVIRRARREVRPGRVVLSPIVVVECDGHDFHERTKEQASRDKERDRFMQTAGYYVLRFTGSEIWKDAAACAEQVDTFLDEHLGKSRDATKVMPVEK